MSSLEEVIVVKESVSEIWEVLTSSLYMSWLNNDNRNNNNNNYNYNTVIIIEVITLTNYNNHNKINYHEKLIKKIMAKGLIIR